MGYHERMFFCRLLSVPPWSMVLCIWGSVSDEDRRCLGELCIVKFESGEDRRGPEVCGSVSFSVTTFAGLFHWVCSGVWRGVGSSMLVSPVSFFSEGSVVSLFHVENLRKVEGLCPSSSCSSPAAHSLWVLVRASLRAISESSSLGESGDRSNIISPLWV